MTGALGGGARNSWPTIPGYEVLAEIGRGGFGTVYQATQGSVERVVAVKVLGATGGDEATERRFRAEARAVGALSWHHHVVSLYDAGVSPDGHLYLVMELLTGGSLGERVRAGDPLDADELLEVAIQMTDALSAAHQAGVLHRDVKPDNILLNRQGEYVLSDFGIATLDDGTQSTTGSYSGTYAFSAPELLRGSRASESSDLYSLGATLHALASGRAPFTSKADATPAATLLRILEDPVPDLPTGVPSTLASLICSLMAKDPEERPRSAADLRAALDSTTARRSATSTTGVSSDGPTADVVGETMTGGGAETRDEPSSKSAGPAREADPDAPTVTRAPAPTLARSPAEAVKVPETGPDRDAGGPPSSGSAPPRASDPSPSEAPRRKRILLIASLVIVAVLAGLGFVVSGRDSGNGSSGSQADSAWDPRVLLTLETRMEHGYQQWCAAEAAEVPG